MNIIRQTKSNEARRLVIEKLVLTILNGCGLKSSPVSNVPWEVQMETLREWSIHKPIHLRLKYQPESKFFSIDRNVVEITKAVLWLEVFSDSIWMARTCDLRNFINAISPIKTVDAFEYYDKSEIMSMFHRIDKMKINELRNKIKELCIVKY
jgi:hypothetical protein